jgi:ADP-ribose pyrophosphatase YjhB (NUDIX family)
VSGRRALELADELRAIATTGLHYAQSPFDRDRYERVLRLAAELAALSGAGAAADLERTYREADRGYVTPKVDVRTAVFRGDRVLLVRERIDGLWALPGGWADIGDSPSDAAARETAEEAGIEVRIGRLVGVFDYRLRPEAPPMLFHAWKLVMLGEERDPGASPSPGQEVTEAAFHPVRALPPLSLGRTLPLHIDLAHRASLSPTPTPPHLD